MKLENNLILQILLNNAGFLTLDAISSESGYSKRKVQQILDDIDIILVEHQLPRIIRVPSKGICVDKKAVKNIQGLFKDQHFKQIDFFNLDDRILLIVYSLTFCKGRITTDYWQQYLRVSKRTINKDVKAVKDIFSQKGIEIVFEVKSGYQFTNGFHEIKTYLINEICNRLAKNKFDSLVDYLAFINSLLGIKFDITLEHYLQIKQFLLDILPVSFTGISLDYLIIYLIFSSEQRVTFFSGDISTAAEYGMDTTALDLANIICEQYYHITQKEIGKHDRLKIVQILLSASYSHSNEFHTDYPFELEVISQTLIESVSLREQFPFNKDVELYHTIIHHMISLVDRVKYHTQIQNPLLSTIERKYRQLSLSVNSSMGLLEEYTGQSITEAEASYFTLYFASSIEKIKYHRNRKNKVIIVCNSGNAVSRLLEFKLKNLFNIEIEAIISKREISEYVKQNDVDTVITIEDIQNADLHNIDILKVCSLLDEDDINRLSNYFNKISKNEAGQLMQAYKDPQRGLLDLLPESNFTSVNRVNDLQELITIAGNLLSSCGYTKEEYTLSMLKLARREGVLKTIQIVPGIIFPHAGISSNVLKPGLSLVTIKEPYAQEGYEIFCAIALCTTDKNIHKNAVRELGILLNRNEFIQGLKTVRFYSDFMELVNNNLK